MARSRRDPDAFAVLEGHLGHTFADPRLIEAALTHRSYANENPSAAPHNERLEFLGDAVLGLAIAHLLMEACPDRAEGELSALRSRIVSEPALAAVAEQIGLGQWLYLGRGEELSGGRQKPSLQADALEAVFGAIYTERGFDYTLGIVRRLFGPRVAELACGSQQDYKSMLQEWVQARSRTRPRYEVVSAEGPDHGKIFTVEVWLEDRPVAQGKGRSKREAGQAAAAAAMEVLLQPEGEARARADQGET